MTIYPTAYGTWRTKYGTGGGPLHTKYYECTGNEKRFSECDSYNETISRTHNDDVGIYCRPGMCKLHTVNRKYAHTVIQTPT